MPRTQKLQNMRRPQKPRPPPCHGGRLADNTEQLSVTERPSTRGGGAVRRGFAPRDVGESARCLLEGTGSTKDASVLLMYR